LVGVALLGAFFAGVGLAARSANRIAPALAAGPIAGFVVYAAHAPLDWDWQMPAVTLVAIVLAGALLALSGEAQSSSAIRGASRRKIQTANTHTAA
jgi:peptidoglycan/LPS O-acetylase OafA/YrhL